MYQLTNQPLINRDKESDIRIKLPQVSKHQAVIKVDENGKAFITNLSKTNPTIVNGNSIEDIEISYLTHGDEILIGDDDLSAKSQSIGNRLPITQMVGHKTVIPKPVTYVPFNRNNLPPVPKSAVANRNLPPIPRSSVPNRSNKIMKGPPPPIN